MKMSLRVQATYCDPGGPMGCNFQREKTVNISTQTQKWESVKEQERSGKDIGKPWGNQTSLVSLYIF